MACAILIIVGSGSAHAQPPKCDSTIYQCGCTIGTPGTYELANELDASQGLTVKNGCIDIEGQNIKLNAAYPIVGPGNDGSCGCMHDPTGAGGPSVNCPSVKVKLASPPASASTSCPPRKTLPSITAPRFADGIMPLRAKAAKYTFRPA